MNITQIWPLVLSAQPPPPPICHGPCAAGKWEYSLGEGADGRSLQLDVAFGRYLDTSAIQADVQPRCVRLLAKGRLLQLALPEEVAPDAAVAQRSKVTGNLLITMPLAEGALACVHRPVAAQAGRVCSAVAGSTRAGSKAAELAAPAELPPAVLTAGDDDEPPPL